MNAIDDINFHYLQVRFHLSKRRKLKDFIKEIFITEQVNFEAVNLIFCTDEYLLEISKEHLHHDTYTDIVTFQLSKKSEPVISDIYISTPRVKENAVNYQTTFTRELHRVIFHGILHLCGYKDKSEKSVKTMRAKEDFYLNHYFVPREI